MPISELILSAQETTLIGNYNEGDTVLVRLDTSDGPFTVELPDGLSCRQTTFKFIHIEVSRVDVTLQCSVSGKKIMNEDTQTIRGDSDLLILNSLSNGNFV